MQKRGLSLLIFLVLLSSSVCAFSFSKIEPNTFYEGSSASFKISVNNFFQNLTVEQVEASTAGIAIIDTFAMGWQVNVTGAQATWYGATIPPNFWGVALFNFTITGPAVLADTNLTFVVTKVNNDTSTASENHTITLLNDATPPVIASLNPENASLANVMQTITADVQENESQLNNVTYTYGDCNGTNTTIVLSCTGSTCTGQADFTSFNEGDVACYTLYAENNVGGSTAQTGNITFHGTPPTVADVNPAPGTMYTESEAIYITANVTDDGTVDTVLARVQYPNGTTENIPLTWIAGTSKYSRLFNTPSLMGTYDVTIVANDTRGNVNSSGTTNFIIVPDYTFNLNLNPSTARPGRAVRISGTVKLSNGSDIPENQVTIDVRGTETNVTLNNGSFSYTFNAPQNTGSYNIYVRVYANSGYTYSSMKRLTVSNSNAAGGSSGWGWDFDEFEGGEGYFEDSGVTEAPEEIVTEDAGVAKAPEQKDAGAVIEEEPTPEEVIDEILSKPNQITGSAVGLGGKASLLALLLLVLGLITLAYSNARIRRHLRTFAKERVGGRLKKKAPENTGFSDEEWEEYFKKLRGED